MLLKCLLRARQRRLHGMLVVRRGMTAVKAIGTNARGEWSRATRRARARTAAEYDGFGPAVLRPRGRGRLVMNESALLKSGAPGSR